jgi:hypothetical protein
MLNDNLSCIYGDCRDKGTWEWEYGGDQFFVDGIDEVHAYSYGFGVLICYGNAQTSEVQAFANFWF